MIELPKTTREFRWNVGLEGRMWERWESVTVDCVKERGKYYASVNSLNASSIGVGNTEEDAYAEWAKKCNARAVTK